MIIDPLRVRPRETPAPVRRLECAVCGNDAGRWRQHWNRDTGYGVCRKCIDWLRRTNRATEDEIADNYGVEGVNFEGPVEETK